MTLQTFIFVIEFCKDFCTERKIMTKLSIIVPIHNTEKYLSRCLDSLINQSLEDIEILCVNDGSTDRSEEILAQYASKESRIKVYSQKNLGPSSARNCGVQQATGEYLGFVDSDDFVDVDYFTNLYTVAKVYNAEIACGNIIRENKEKKKYLIKYSDIIIADDIKTKYELSYLPQHCYVWNKIYKREALLKTGIKFINGMYFEDMIFSPNVLEKLGRLVTYPETFYHYWINKNSIVTTSSDKNRSDAIEANKYLMKKCKQYNIFTPNSTLISKNEYFFLGLKILKVYEYRATKKYSLFGLFPILEMRAR